MVTALGLKGYDVLVASDGRDGLEIARRERPRVILLDLLMPGIDGYEMLRLLRDHPETCEIPVVIMSARGDLEGLAPPLGVQDYLLKPFDLDDMEGIVEKYAGPGVPPAAAGTADTPAGEAPPAAAAPAGIPAATAAAAAARDQVAAADEPSAAEEVIPADGSNLRPRPWGDS